MNLIVYPWHIKMECLYCWLYKQVSHFQKTQTSKHVAAPKLQYNRWVGHENRKLQKHDFQSRPKLAEIGRKQPKFGLLGTFTRTVYSKLAYLLAWQLCW